MKQLIFVLCCIILMGILVIIYMVPSLKEWTEYGKNDLRGMLLTVIGTCILPRPVAEMIVFLAKAIFPTQERKRNI